MPLRRLPVVALVALLAVATAAPSHADGPLRRAQNRVSASGQNWAPAETATIHPGVQTFTDGGQCTANFIFTDATSVYIGQAAHCASTEGNAAVDGCTTEVLPVGTTVQVGQSFGTLVYSSWSAMQAVPEHERDPAECAGNDFALVRIDPADVGKVNPSVPFWGGPNGIANGTTARENVYSFGNSNLRLGLTALSPKQGVAIGDSNAGWTHSVYMATPGIPGDSGAANLNHTGAAYGVLSTIEVLPRPLSNALTDLRMALDYMRAHSPFTGVVLALGTEPFSPLI